MQTILEAVREHELGAIPTLCHSPELEPYASCFLCVVEVKGRPNLVPACATRVAPGMEVTTRNDRIVESRKTALELLLSNHYADCVSPCLEGCPAARRHPGVHRPRPRWGSTARRSTSSARRTRFRRSAGASASASAKWSAGGPTSTSRSGSTAIKRFVTDQPGAYDGAPACDPPTGKKVAIVGAGPAGLTAAWFLGRKGHKPVIYEAKTRPGGMLRYGIPAYRLPDDVIDREVEYICRAGAEIRYGTRVGQGHLARRAHEGARRRVPRPRRLGGQPDEASEGEFEHRGRRPGRRVPPRAEGAPGPDPGHGRRRGRRQHGHGRRPDHVAARRGQGHHPVPAHEGRDARRPDGDRGLPRRGRSRSWSSPPPSASSRKAGS